MPNTEQSIEETGGVPEIEMEVEVFGMIAYPTDRTLTVDGMAADAKATGEAIADLTADIANIFASLYPVGSLYMTAADVLPATIAAIGTWEEVLVPLTWGDIRTGVRNYANMEAGQIGGTLHMWLRTE